MRSTRRPLILCLAVLLVLGPAGFWWVRWLARPVHRITPENIDQIYVGMTRKEVEALFGVPPGTYARGKASLVIFHHNEPVEEWMLGPVDEWVGEEAAVMVYFNESGLVSHHRRTAVATVEEAFHEKLRRWLGF